MNKFSQLFSNFTNVQLLKITHNPDDYEPLALQTAKEELESRNLSEEEMQMSVTEFYELEKRKALQEQKNRDLVKKFSLGFLNKSNINKQILLIGLVYLGFALYGAYTRFSMYLFMFEEGTGSFTLLAMELFPFVLLVMFWFRTKLGWVLFTLNALLTAVGYVISMWNVISPLNDTYFTSPRLGVSYFLMMLLKCVVFGFFSFLMLQKPMRKAFGWGKQSEDLDVLDEELIKETE